jgi:alkylation response protein AidB-like acyl-CoA dehydrogenase
VDFSEVVLTESQQAFADELNAFLDEQLTDAVYEEERVRSDRFNEKFYLALGAKGWIRPRWPVEDGGAGLDEICAGLIQTELLRREAPHQAIELIDWVWPPVERHGDPELRAELKPKIADGTVRLCLGYSEPDGGSDIAAAKVRAVRDGDEWVINGSKIFTSGAHISQYTFLITRTDPTLPKHKGITMFLCPLDTPGVEIQALSTIGDDRTNIVYFSDVRISDRYRVGGVNDGWAVLHAPLDEEHGIGMAPSKLRDLSVGDNLMRCLRPAMEAAVRWAKHAPAAGTGAVIDDKAFLAGIGRILVHMEATTCTPGAQGRVKGAEVAILGAEELLDLVGPAGTLPFGADGAIEDGVIESAHRFAQGTATYGGTVEVFRNLIAEHILGLPHADYPGRRKFIQRSRAVA